MLPIYYLARCLVHCVCPVRTSMRETFEIKGCRQVLQFKPYSATELHRAVTRDSVPDGPSVLRQRAR